MNEPTNRISFFSEKVSLSVAKRKASIHFNHRDRISVVNEFNYVTSTGVYVFTRINKISPNNHVIFGIWR
jgi:hypothetical protein